MKPLTDIQLYDFLEKNHDAILQEMILVQKSHDHMTVTRSNEIPRMTANIPEKAAISIESLIGAQNSICISYFIPLKPYFSNISSDLSDCK